MSRFQPSHPRPEPVNPRRVRGGLKLNKPLEEIATSWAASRWLRLIEDAATGDTITTGLEYAQVGQTKSLSVREGAIEAIVQGRRARPYTTSMHLAPISQETWDLVEAALVDGASHAARLAAGELQANIEDVFAPLGTRLFPLTHDELRVECDCGKEAGVWCKHAVALAYLFSLRLMGEPLAMLTLRGCPIEELSERLRSRRAVVGQDEAVPVYAPHLAGLADQQDPPLEEVLEGFWDAPMPLDDLDIPIEAGEVDHPLLRRLGQTPFSDSRFPMVGLLATCYDLIGEKARQLGERYLGMDDAGEGQDDGFGRDDSLDWTDDEDESEGDSDSADPESH